MGIGGQEQGQTARYRGPVNTTAQPMSADRESALAQIDGHLNCLHHLIEQLERHLSPILQTPVQPPSAEKLLPAGTALYSLSARLRESLAVLEGIIHRIEL